MRGLLRIVTAQLFPDRGTKKLLWSPAMPMPAGALPGGEMPSCLATLVPMGGIADLVGGTAVPLMLASSPVTSIPVGECAAIFWMMHVPMGAISKTPYACESAALFCLLAGPGTFAIDNPLGRKNAAA